MSIPTSTPNATLSFLGCVTIAVRQAQQQYPNARLLEVDAQATMPGQPSPIKSMRVVFGVDNNTLFLTMTQWGEFSSQLQAGPWVGDMVITWPVPLDVVEASDLMKQAGYTEPYGAITLRQPLYPGTYEPSYIFAIGNLQYVFVGVNDKKVTFYQQPAEVTATTA